MECRKCGRPMNDNAQFCPGCGNVNSSYRDYEGIAWGILGFCIPLVGIILFIVLIDDKPQASKYAGIGALISIILSIIAAILF